MLLLADVKLTEEEQLFEDLCKETRTRAMALAAEMTGRIKENRERARARMLQDEPTQPDIQRGKSQPHFRAVSAILDNVKK